MKFSYLQSLAWLIPLFLLLLGANLWLFFRREWEESHYPASYATLYHPLDMPTLRGWTIEGDGLLRLDLVWNRAPAQWELTVDGKPAGLIAGDNLRLQLVGPKYDGSSAAPLTDFKHTYVLRPLPVGSGPDLEFTITSIDHGYYKTRGMHFPNDILLVKTDVPIGRFKRHAIADWVDDYRYIGAAALAEADRLVRDEIGILDTDDTLTRMAKIVRFMRTQLANAGGVPKDAFRWLDPYSIFKEMRDGTGKGWCTQNAQIFAFFANRAGLPTRFIFGATTQHNSVIYNGHSWTETWVQEQNRWAYCDALISIVAVLDRRGRVLNSADVFHLCEHATFEGVQARIFKDWHWQKIGGDAPPRTAVTVPFSDVNEMARIEFTRQTIIKYRRPPNVEDLRDKYGMLLKSRVFAWTNLRRYLCRPDAAYSHLPTNGPANYRLRQSLFGALTVTVFLIVAAFLSP